MKVAAKAAKKAAVKGKPPIARTTVTKKVPAKKVIASTAVKKAAPPAKKATVPAKAAAKAPPPAKKAAVVPAAKATKKAPLVDAKSPAPAAPPVPAPAPKPALKVEAIQPTAPTASTTAANPVVKQAASVPAPVAKPAANVASPAAKKEGAAPTPITPPRVFVPDRPRSILGVAALPPGGMPEWWRWHQDYPGEETLRRGTVLTSFNLYAGIYTDTLRIHMAAGVSGIRAVSYSSKFTIDGDGSGGKQRGDANFKDTTSLHYNDGSPPSKKNSLDSLTYPFAVLPLPPKSSSIPDFHALGLDVGDIGIAFFGRGQAAPFIYGNEGPPQQVGEGSVQMARDLGLEWEEKKMTVLPPKGGFSELEMRQYAPGVLHIAFPGSRDRPDRTTDILTRETLHTKAWDLFKRWKQSLRGGAL